MGSEKKYLDIKFADIDEYNKLDCSNKHFNEYRNLVIWSYVAMMISVVNTLFIYNPTIFEGGMLVIFNVFVMSLFLILLYKWEIKRRKPDRCKFLMGKGDMTYANQFIDFSKVTSRDQVEIYPEQEENFKKDLSKYLKDSGLDKMYAKLPVYA